MIKIIKKRLLMAIICLLLYPNYVSASSLIGNPNITWSPDKNAFTTDAGEASYDSNLKKGYEINTGVQSTMRVLATGEHYYKEERQGVVSIGRWEVEWDRSQCIHNSYPNKDDNFHGILFNKSNCYSFYKKGWKAYCADCKEEIVDMFFYMDKETAQSIKDLDLSLVYYYLCPHCNNLEQGAGMGKHKCNKISWNRYKIKYNANWGSGYMLPTTHMYNNATLFDGEPITPSTRLNPNTYIRFGYEFTGWNTRADGTGKSYTDKQEIFNLTSKNNDEIILYAQWKPSYSTLHIDPASGTYDGKNAVTSTRQQAGKTYLVDPAKLTPPDGYLVSFETNGGSAVANQQTEKKFQTWQQNFPFHGEFQNHLYTHRGKDGTEDHLTATYDDLPIVLPSTSKLGESFAGWYKDPEYQELAGVPGEKIIVTQDAVLYAKWATLVLTSTDNYRVNNGKGAVDLAWNQDDITQKTYKLYQSRDAKDWQTISQKLGADELQPIEESFGCSNAQQQYTVPYTGLYTLIAAGAQGQDYGVVPGGYGGTTEMNVWLNSGDTLTYVVGGRNGYNGGGAGNPYGYGGGATTIASAQKGILLIAGGGGGASVAYVGGAGGLSQSLTETSTGGSGGAGGGGGYKGGSAGEQIVHYHTDACYHITDKNILATPVREDVNPRYVYEYDNDDNPRYAKKITLSYGSLQSPIATEGAITLKLEANQNNRWGNTGQYICTDLSGIKVYDQSGTLIYSQSLQELNNFIKSEYRRAITGNNMANGVVEEATMKSRNDLDNDQSYNNTDYTWLHYNANGTVTKYKTNFDDPNRPYNIERNGTIYPIHNPWEYFMPEIHSEGNNDWWGSTLSIQRVNVPIPAGTAGIYIEYTACSVESHGLPTAQVAIASLSGGKQLICGYTDGQVVASYPSYGGSNYASNRGTLISSNAGTKTGDGIVTIRLKNAEYFDSLTQSGVKATDYAPPDKVAEDTMKKVPISSNNITLTWEKPKDNGTKYYHKAESYNAASGGKLCDSNITHNTLTSGIAGYYWLLDTAPGTNVNSGNGSYLTATSQTLTLTASVQYFHVAAVDIAGNIGATTHVKVGNADEEVTWEIMTTPIQVSSDKKSIHPAGNGSYYVRADGETPFLLRYSGFMNHETLPGYQINRLLFLTTMVGSGDRQDFLTQTPSQLVITAGEIVTEAEEITKSMTGQPFFGDATYTITRRSNLCQNLMIEQKFTIDATYHGDTFEVIPRAGVDHKKGVEYSKDELDGLNSVTIIADAEAPFILGTEILENLQEIDRADGTVHLNLQAEDALSGVKDFYVEIVNTDNYNKQTYNQDDAGNLFIDITEDTPLFNGDFVISIHAIDNVGNEAEAIYSTTEFSLVTDITRILEPHDPIFQTGESGLLHIYTTGYVDKVTVSFPKAFLKKDPKLNHTYTYEIPAYLKEEELQFMVPLYVEEGEYEIEVTAYKNGVQIQDYPALNTITVSGTVLDDFRTRLR